MLPSSAEPPALEFSAGPAARRLTRGVVAPGSRERAERPLVAPMGALVHGARDVARGNALLWHGYLAIATVLSLFYLFLPPLKGQPALIELLGLSGAAAVAVGVRRSRPAAADAWRCFAFGLLLAWAGNLYTRTIVPLAHLPVHFPSAGDALHLSAYPALMGGLLLLVRRRRQTALPGAHASNAIDTMIITLGLALLSGFVLIAPYLHDTALPVLPKLVSTGFPLADIILLAAATRLAVDSSRKEPAFYLLMMSMVSLLAVDFAYGILRLHNSYHGQLLLDAGWIAFYVLWGAAALHPSMRDLDQGDRNQQPKLTWFRLTLLAAASMVAPTIGLVKEVGSSDPNVLVIIGSSIVLFGLVIWRMADLVRQREQTAARERTLARAGSSLVAASSHAEIARAVLEATAPLIGDEVRARLCLAAPGGVEMFALRAGARIEQWVGPAELPEELSSLALAPWLRLPRKVEQVTLLEVDVRQERVGALVLAAERALSDGERLVLSSLITQTALALESAALNEEMHRRSSEAWITSLVQNASDLITVLDEELHIIYQSPSVRRVLGFSPEQLVGQPFQVLLDDRDRDHVLRRLRDGGTREQPEAIECVLLDHEGASRYFEILRTNLPDGGVAGGIVLNGRDVSERRAFEEQLAHQAFHDPVTHLANRALFNERVRHAVARSRREGAGLAVIFLDLDDFKTVNDSLGHESGDRVLREVAERLTLGLRAGDTVARFGGDEFAVLLEDVDSPPVAAEAAERLLGMLHQPLQLDEKDIRVRASLGISLAEPGRPADGDELIRNADAAMYIAKAEGKGTYRLFEPAMHQKVLSRLELRADLERALAENQFELYYQPSVRLRDGQVQGVEALLRWHHPTRGLVAPDDFIPFAEESGLIVPIGRWVLQEGCRQGARMRAELLPAISLSIAINLSVKQIFDPDIVRDVAAALQISGLEPSALTLEITESTMMVDTDLAVERLEELKALGLRLAIDDFGTGYSSLSYLSRFPVDIVKMDRSLLKAGADTVTNGLVGAVVSLGETFELAVVAEGIEWREQWQSLRELGCDLGQGFYFSRPLEQEGTLRYLREHAAASLAA